MQIKLIMRKISFTHILLISIGIILFLGLFKNEFKVWKFKNWPGFREKEVVAKATCSREISNPEYTKYVEESLLKCGISEENKLRLIDRIAREDECLRRSDIKKDVPIQKIMSYYVCNKTINETWFFALGKYWFKKE